MGAQHAIQITLRGSQNITYRGTLILTQSNWSGMYFGEPEQPGTTMNMTTTEKPYDQKGASYYVVAVVLVYGMSIVALIASHIKRRHAKVLEDKQIDKYLQDFQIVREKHDRDNYRNLKKTIMTKINWDRGRRGTVRNLQSSILPLLAVAGIHRGSHSHLHRNSTGSSRGSLHNDSRDRRRVYPRSRREDDSMECRSDSIEESPRNSLRGSCSDVHRTRQTSIPSIPEERESDIIIAKAACEVIPRQVLEQDLARPSSPPSPCQPPSPCLPAAPGKHPHIYLTIEPPSDDDLKATAAEQDAPDSGLQRDSLEAEVVWLGQQGRISPMSPDSGCDTPGLTQPGTPSRTPSPSPRRTARTRSPSPRGRRRRSLSPTILLMKNGYGSKNGASLSSPGSPSRDCPNNQRGAHPEETPNAPARERLLHITCL